jgi:6-phosphogluconolactonase
MKHVVLGLALVIGCSGGSEPEGTRPVDSGGNSGGSAGMVGTGGSDGSGGAGTGGSSGSAGSEADAAGTPDTGTGEDKDAAVEAGTTSHNPYVYVSGYDPEIRIFQLDMTTGVLVPRGTAEGGTSPSYLAWDPSRRHMYAVQEYDGPGRIVAYTIDPASGALERINDAPSYGSKPAHLSVHPSGKWVLSSNWTSGHIAVLPILPTGGVGDSVYTAQPVNANAHMIISDATGKFVFVACTGPKRVLQYSIDATSGQLTANDPPSVADPGSPRHIAFHPSANYAYAIDEAGGSVTSFKYDAPAGKLSFIESIPAAPSKGSGAHIIVHPSGKFVYASVRGDNSIGIFSVSAADGRLTRIMNETAGGMIKTPRDFNQDPTGTFLIVANQSDGSVIVFRINQEDGRLTVMGRTETAPSPSFVGILPLP